MTKNIVLYSWRNNTENKSYILEMSDLLNQQKKRGDVCTCIINNQPCKIGWRGVKANILLRNLSKF